MKFAKFIALLLLTAACSKPPSYTVKPGNAGNGVPNPPSEGQPKGPGGADNPIVGTIPTDKFVGLTCLSNSDPKGFRAWRRLSNREFKNTIVEFFGANVEGEVKDMIDDVNKHDIYDTLVTPTNYVDVQRLRNYRAIAKAVAGKTDLGKIFPCLKEGESCISKTIPEFGARVWRRPMAADETQKLVGIFKSTLADGLSAEEAARFVIQALVSSHHFIYRSEMGDKGNAGVYTLTPWEVASAISYTILRLPPDEKLRQAAAANKLNSIEEIKAEAIRLFADPRSKNAWKDFAGMWLDAKTVMETEKSAKEFDKVVRERARDEVGELFADVIFKASGATLEALLTADSVPAPAGNNIIYDAMSNNGRITFKESERRGVFGQTSYLAAHANVEETSPVKRGAFIVERMLCNGFPPVPVFELPKKKDGQTNRERYDDIAKNPACGACHKTIHGFGYVFENFDHLGRFRQEAEGEKVDASGLVLIDGEEKMVSGPTELASSIAKSKEGRECFARHVFRYGLGRLEYAPLHVIGGDGKPREVTMQADLDSCQIKSMADKMEDAGGDMKTAIINLLSSSGFLQRIDRKTELKAE